MQLSRLSLRGNYHSPIFPTTGLFEAAERRRRPPRQPRPPQQPEAQQRSAAQREEQQQRADDRRVVPPARDGQEQERQRRRRRGKLPLRGKSAEWSPNEDAVHLMVAVGASFRPRKVLNL